MNSEKIKSKIENDSIVFEFEKEEGFDKNEIYSLGIAFCRWLQDKLVTEEKDIAVAIGYNESEASLLIKDIVISAFDKVGATIYDCKKTLLPAMFRTVIGENANGGIFVSSNEKNVQLKFVSRIGYLIDEQIAQIADFFKLYDYCDLISREPRINNSLKVYAENARQLFCKAINSTDFSRPLRGLKFVVDSSGGIGDYFVNYVLLPLGAEVVEISGENVIQKECNNVSATVGLKFDSSFSGLKIFSKKYGALTKEAFTFLVLNILQEEKDEATILTNYTVTPKVKELIEIENIKFEYVDDTVYKLIKIQNEMNDNGVNCPVVITSNGVCSFHSNHSMIDPSFIVYKLILKIIALRDEGKNIDDILDKVYEYSNEWKIKINSFDKQGYAKTVLNAFEGYSMKNTKWLSEFDENIIRNKNEKYSFEIENCDNEFILIRISAISTKVQYQILEEIYTYFSKFTSLNFEELEGIF